MVVTSTRSPPIWRVMSATSGSDATTRSAAAAVAARDQVTAAANAALALREAMAVTPDEGRPLQGEALVVGTVDPDVVPLEPQTLELGGLPADERRVGALQVLGTEDALGVVEARARREA